MRLIDRKRLAKLMAIQGVSARQLARAAGWRSHSYMNRLLAGDVTTLEVEPAVRIAKHLGVGTDDLFMARLSSDVKQQSARRDQSPERVPA
jgi:transcriptional regulator with XRE-family HTH domain